MNRLFFAVSMLITILATAQIDSIGKRTIGLTAAPQVTGIMGSLNTSAAIGYNVGVFYRKEIDECHHHLLEITYGKAGFIEAFPKVQWNNISFELFYLQLLVERGTEIFNYVRLNYGLNMKFLTGYEGSVWAHQNNDALNPIDIGINGGLTYYPTEQISIGMRYTQGWINVFQAQNYDKHISGLNWAVAIQIHAAFF